MTIVSRIAAILIGLIIAAAMIVGGLLLFPQLRPHTNYQERTYRNQSMEIHYRHRDGDLFPALGDAIRPPEDDSILASFVIGWDENGFRVPAMTADAYPIAVFGDSYTEGFNVARPWADGLANELGIPVYNYGYRGYGPQEVATTATEFANAEPRQWVLYAFFSGNDLGDATRSPIEYKTLDQILSENNPSPGEPDPNKNYDFPMPVIIGANYYELVFLNYYLWNHIAPPEGFEASENFKVFDESLNTIATAIPEETCLGLIFIPTKEQLYYPYIYETEQRWLHENAAQHSIKDGELSLDIQAIDTSAAEVTPQLTQLRDTVAQTVNEHPQWQFIDLLPAFTESVSEGNLLYYPYDSHWNQDGHDLAARVIADVMQQQPDCPLS